MAFSALWCGGPGGTIRSVSSNPIGNTPCLCRHLKENNCSLFPGALYKRKKLFVKLGLRVLKKHPDFWNYQLHPEVYISEMVGEDSFNAFPKMSVLPDLEKSLEIIKYPDPRLRNENKPVDPNDPAVRLLAKKMFLLMYEGRGVGLAAPQVGINQRLMVYNPEGKQHSFLSEVVLINPQIVDCSEKKVTDLEGCLSFPGIAAKVSRHTWVRIEAYKPGGKKIKLKLEGWQARIFQHEYDHLDGVLFIDRMEPEERERAQPVLNELVKNYKGEGKPSL
eukprot:jgi/Galph1/1727/GphlegSOOS_G405.1